MSLALWDSAAAGRLRIVETQFVRQYIGNTMKRMLTCTLLLAVLVGAESCCRAYQAEHTDELLRLGSPLVEKWDRLSITREAAYSERYQDRIFGIIQPDLAPLRSVLNTLRSTDEAVAEVTSLRSAVSSLPHPTQWLLLCEELDPRCGRKLVSPFTNEWAEDTQNE